MPATQAVSTILLIVAFLALAGYYAWRQRQTLRRLRTADELSPEDQHYLRRQAWRRLAGSVLMVLFASLLAGSFFIEDRAQELADRNEAAYAQEEPVVLEPEDRQFRNFWVVYWIVLLVGVMVILGLAAWDSWATHRYGLRHYRKLQADRRAMLEREIAQLRRDRNGHI